MSLSKIICLIILLLGVIGLAADAELVGYWSFDEADGVDDLSGNGTEGLPFTIGSRNGQNHFAGAVDEVAFWDEAISVEDSMEPLPVKPKDKLTIIWGAIKAYQ